MPPQPCFSQKELARRWTLSHRTLERWRLRDEGPAYMKLGGRVVYRLEDVIAFETARLQLSGAEPRLEVA
jgi:hypothetical protein